MDPNNPNKKAPKKRQIFFCKNCDFKSSKTSDWNRHIATDKHKILTNPNKKAPKNAASEFVCDCQKSYKHLSSLCAHRKNVQFLTPIYAL